jgi:hypothetical protein
MTNVPMMKGDSSFDIGYSLVISHSYFDIHYLSSVIRHKRISSYEFTGR